MGGWVDGWMGGWMNGWMGGQLPTISLTFQFFIAFLS